MGRSQILQLLKRYGMLLMLAVLVMVLSILSDRFLSFGNFMNITRQVTINGVVAAGMTMVILSGGIDLSVGSVVALAGAVSAGVLASSGSFVLAIFVALAVGGAAGAFNGAIISYAKLPPFIVTLATMALARGMTLVYTGGRPVLVMNEPYEFIGGGYLGPIPFPVVVMAGVYVILFIFLSRHQLGRLIYAIGGNEQACRLSGINVERVKTLIYVGAGMLCGVTAVVLTSRLMSAQPTAGTGYELDAIAAVILGGTSLSGGKGQITGTIIGAFIIGVLGNGLNLLNVSAFYQEVAKGLVILAAVLLDRLLAASGETRRRIGVKGGAASQR